jgi:dihydrofolate synthase / folylpolyglutamate synthase
MRYQDTLEFLYSQLPVFHRIGKAAYKANLDNTIALDTYLCSPHRSYRTIHIAGTNGKGSVSHMLASVLQSAGYRIGLYTSPHLKDFRERIRINGEMISKHAVSGFVMRHKRIIEELRPSFFEMAVAMAFDYFETQKTEVSVIETGLGGRLDSTNIIHPDLSVITNIGFDHTDLLGETLERIATEKAGIIKNGVPVVIGETHQDTSPVFQTIAREKASELIFADQLYFAEISERHHIDLLSWQITDRDGEIIYKDLQSDLHGLYQKKNIITVLAAIEQLRMAGYFITEKDVRTGLALVKQNTGLMGRWQILGNQPLIIADTGHNQHGIKEVINQISITPHKNLHMVIGMVQDKNHESILSLLPKEATYYFTQANIPRSLDGQILKEYAYKFKLIGEVYKDVNDAIKAAKRAARPEDLIFIGGSTFIVAEAL